MTGVSGTGKSTFAIQYLVNRDFTCRFIFDPDGEYSGRLKIPAATRPGPLEQSVLSRWCIFDPTEMFPGDNRAGFAAFCDYAWKLSARTSGGRFVLFVDEVQLYTHPSYVPKELSQIAEAGRKRGLELLIAGQRPNRIHGDLRAQWTEWVSFYMHERNSLEALEECGFSPDEVAALPDLHYIARSDKGGELRGVISH